MVPKWEDYPEAELDTPLGKVTLVVLDPMVYDDDPRKFVFRGDERVPERQADCRLEAKGVKVNGIAIDFRVEFKEGRRFKARDDENDKGERYFWPGTYTTVTRSEGGGYDNATSNQRQKVYALGALAMAFLDAHPELKVRARLVTLQNRVLRTTDAIGDKRKELEQLEELERRQEDERDTWVELNNAVHLTSK